MDVHWPHPKNALNKSALPPASQSSASMLSVPPRMVVFFSYRQTIAAYPGGGGSYAVAHQNLGTFAGLLAGAALMID